MEWKPIDSAPKDGTVILLGFASIRGGAEGSVDVGYWMNSPETNYWREVGWFATDDDVLTQHPQHPTHWMPLPEPPPS